jgi:dipeptidyl aminopeptidase/acylaminoacyl peptidase
MGGVIRAIVGVAALLALTGCGGSHARPRPAQVRLVYLAGDENANATVWIAGPDGAHARRLGRGSAAVLSPDGRTVAVRRRGGIYLLPAKGGAARLLTARHLHPEAWSPDGQTLIATRQGQLAVLELDGIDRRSGRVRVIASGSVYGFAFSPDGHDLVYSRAGVVTGGGPCTDQFDLYTVKLSGGKPTRLTHDGVSGFPVWGDKGIAFSHFPAGTDPNDCQAPGIWTIDSDGSHPRPLISRAPTSLSSEGLYGLQPLAWIDDEHILAGVRTDSGTQGVVLDTQTHKLRYLRDFAETVSSDGRFSVGGGGTSTGVHLSIMRLSDGHRVFRLNQACCPSWNR